MKIRFDQEKCTGCFSCYVACIAAHHRPEEEDAKSYRRIRTVVDEKAGFQKKICPGCIHCGRCMESCPSGALLSGPECPLFVRFVYPGLSMTCKTAVSGSPGFWRCPGLSLSPGRSSCMWPYSFTWLFLACGHAKNAGYGGASGDEPARLPFPEISRARVWEAGFLPAGQSPLGNPCMP